MTTKLTKAQENKITKTRDFWLDRFFSCEHRTNRKQATKYINWMYEFAGYKKPMIIFLDSPLAMQIGANALVNFLSKNGLIGAKKSQIDSQIDSKIDSKISSQIRSKISSQIYSKIGSQISSQIYSQICSQIGLQIYSKIGSQIDSQNVKYFSSGWSGTVWYWSWDAYLSFYNEAKLLPKELFELHNNVIALNKANCYDMIKLDGLCVVSDMPTKIVRNQENRLHNTEGMAIEWSDGFGGYYLNGINFDEKLFKKVTNQKVHPKDIFAIENTEQRRVAYEIMDKTKMKKLKGFKVLDKVKDDGYGYKMQVIEFNLDNFDESFKYLNVFCPSTGREYFIETQDTKCVEAKRKSFRLDDEIKIIKEF